MKFRTLFKRKVDTYRITYILREFIENINTKVIIHFEVTHRGVVKLYINRPGILIGRFGKDINELKKRMKKECNAKDVKVFEMKNIVNNCISY